MKTIMIILYGLSSYFLGMFFGANYENPFSPDPETKMMVVCDTLSMELHYTGCLKEVINDTTVARSELKFWREECRTQAIGIACEEKLHVLHKGEWMVCDSLPEKKRSKLCQ